MYIDNKAQLNQKSTEEYLTGKPVDDLQQKQDDEEQPQVNQIDENEAFSRMVNDPMVYIK